MTPTPDALPPTLPGGSPAPQDAPTVAPSATLAMPGQAPLPHVPGYEILGELGRGGMGVVYKARQIGLDRTVALKMVLTGAHAGAEDLARFHTEAEAVARLTHPNIVQIYEVGTADGYPYCSLEFVGGGSLAQRLDGAAWADRDAATLVEALARAMHFAHQKGIIHRDLKPANVLLELPNADGGMPEETAAIGNASAIGTPKITDFGLAKKLDAEAGQTRSGMVMGTPSYMAPEQAAGRLRDVGPATDVYALGAILYELLTGRPPFQAPTAVDTILLVLEQEPPAPRWWNRQMDPALEAICLKCLEKTPADRYPSAAALADDLAAFLNGEPVRAERTSTSHRLFRSLLRASRHTEVMARWGRVWMWHAVQIFVLFVVTNLLTWQGHAQPATYVALWAVGLASLAGPIWYYRFRGGLPLTPLERQLGQVWGMFGAGFLLTGVLNHLMGLPVLKLLPVVVLECGIAFGCMAVILGGSFYLMAAVCAALAVALALWPDVGPALFGAAFAVGLFVPGWRHGRAAPPCQPPRPG